ncbi:MAG TPA: PQQ-dependent sugar dehydrogenase [Actinomycetales bacterium]|nr:PQQ-dependent sugar dehydrogenase [Actinomycetales bacterium]
MRGPRALALTMVAVAALVAPTAPSVAAAAPQPLDDPIPQAIPDSGIRVGLRPVATGMVSPTGGTAPRGDHKHLYVTDQIGRIWGVDLRGRSSKWLVADLTSLMVSDLGKVVRVPYDERGLLGLAFDPGFRHNGFLYTFTNEDPTAPADFTTQPGVRPGGGQAVITRWTVRNRWAKHLTVNPASRRVLMRIDKPQFNHNGGELAFGRDRMLYISVGDGGAADDEGPGHVPGGNAQSLAPRNVLGKILRIDPHGRNSANGRYGIPRSNPFVGRQGADEIWALGFRNPYRFSFDRRTGALIVGDVGQNDIEEVDLVRRGRNYGWPVKEGTFIFRGLGVDNPGRVFARSPGRPAGLVDPVLEYDHTAPGGVRCGSPGATAANCNGIAVVGGYLYRGRDVRALRGHYVFGDYSRGFAQPLGRLFVNDGRRVESMNDPGIAVNGFVQDRKGELYVLGNTTGLLTGNTGQVLRITRAR